MEYYVLDIETNGLCRDYHEITELSIVRCKDLEQRVWLFKTHDPKKSNKDALFITKQNIWEIQKRKYYLDDLIAEINDFINEDGLYSNERIFIAHNATFDRNFVEHYWKKFKSEFPSDYWLDTVAMSKKYIKMKDFQGKTSASLENMLKIANIEENIDMKHTAEGDTRTTFMLWKFLQKNGINNSEFIKLSDNVNLYKTSKINKKVDTSALCAKDDLDCNNVIERSSECENEYNPQDDD